MKTPTKCSAVALISLFSTAAFAQVPVPPGAVTPVPAPAPAPAAPAAPAVPGAPPAEVPPPPPPVSEPPPAPPATTDERVSALEGKVEGLSESYAETKSTASSLAKLKFSGYIQGRYAAQDNDDSISGVDTQGRPTSFNRFLVRRGRLKATYTGENAEYLLQIDATGDGVVLKDAEATFVDTWTPLGLRFTMGQFKVPFGYEVLQSSSDREMPERARVIRALFPGERDRGARLTARWEWLRFMGALVNGNFTQGDPVYNPSSLDNNRFLDTYLRVGGDFGFLVVNVSTQFGQKVATTVTNTALTITDTNMDGVITADEVKPAATTVSMQLYNLWRLGADAQFYFDIPGVGGMALKGEFVLSKDTNKEFRGAPADPCRDVKGFGWILTGSQNIGDYLGIAARFDQWNPNRDVPDTMACMAAFTKAQNDKISTLGVGPLLYISGNLKASAIYEHLWRSPTLGLGQPGIAPNNAVPTDQFTLPLQAKF